MSFGKNIRRLRKEHGWAQIQLAEKLNISQKVLATYEAGTRKPSIELLPKFAQVLGTTVDELLDASNFPENQSKERHGNSRSTKVIEAFEKLQEDEQRVILKQIRALAKK